MKNDTLIKSISTKRYSVELHETPSQLYVITRSNALTEGVDVSEPFKDFALASCVFDLTVSELEGN